MNLNLIRWILAGAALAGLILATGCGMCSMPGKSEAEKAAQQAKEAGQAAEPGIQAMGEAFSKMKEAMDKQGGAEPVDFRELKALLPESAAGLARESAEGEKSGAMGIKVSTAKGRYAGEQSSLDIEITDMGTAAGLTAFASAAWTVAEIDKEDANGHERTFAYRQHKAYEKYANDTREGEIQVLVAQRFIVRVRGTGLSMADIKAALGQVDIDRLDAIAKEAAE